MTTYYETHAPKTLLDGYKRFRTETYPKQREVYEELSHGQQPHTMVIACSDSRVDPATVFDCGPGELFVVRNVANLTPHYMPGGIHGVSSAMEFAVKVLEVKGILVLGHKQCGGVRACAGGTENLDFDFLKPWLEIMNSARAELLETHDPANLDALSEALELHSVYHSVRRLMEFPFIKHEVEAGKLELHGARIGIKHGDLEWMLPDGTFETVTS